MSNLREERIGQRVRQNCGMIAEIIEYNRSDDITVRFEDGQVREKMCYSCFIKGGIKHIDVIEGDVKVMNCGLIARVVKYESSTRVQIKFDNISSIKATHVSSFMSGAVLPLLEVGTKFKSADGTVCRIIKVDNSGSSDSKAFYYDYKGFNCYVSGLRKIIGIILGTRRVVIKPNEVLNKWLRQKNGLLARCVNHDGNCYTVEFEDGSMRSGVSFGTFINGSATPYKRNKRVYYDYASYLSNNNIIILSRSVELKRVSRIDFVKDNYLYIDKRIHTIIKSIECKGVMSDGFKKAYTLNGTSYYIGKIGNERVCDTYEGIKRRLENGG